MTKAIVLLDKKMYTKFLKYDVEKKIKILKHIK